MTDSTPPPQPPPSEPAPSTRTRPIQYKGADLEPARGPGLGCFRFQLVVLVILLVLTPYSVAAGWGEQISAAMLFITLALLLVTGQTIIFLLRIVAADRRGRRRPLAARTPTVGELEAAGEPPGRMATEADRPAPGARDGGAGEPPATSSNPEGMRQ